MTDASSNNIKSILEGLDLSSPDGRAGVQSLIRRIEEKEPGFLEQAVARIQSRRLGLAVRDIAD